MEIDSHGYWIGYDKKEHRFDAALADAILEIANINEFSTIMDVGCGEGKYVELFRSNGMICSGYDGNPKTVLLNGKCKVLDFAVPVDVEPADLVVSLEVGEHIPEEFEDVFISNLVSHANKMIILSWGIPGQGGFGHVNCRENKYIIKKITGFGWLYSGGCSEFLRMNCSIRWFTNTMMVFEKW